MEIKTKYHQLVSYLKKLDSVLVAYSGGVDSTLLLAAALDALGRDKVLAVTATSPIHSPEEMDEARRLTNVLGVQWQDMASSEMGNPDFLSNPPDRCYHCKKIKLAGLIELAVLKGLAYVVEGSNYSDLQDYRPGYRAVQETGVLSPLLEIRMTKEEIRSASRKRGISCWDKPSNACLCSRIPYGQAITVDRLHRVYMAEKIIVNMGFNTVRVRDHGDIARIEVAVSDLEKICQDENRVYLSQRIKELGFKYVTVDMMGYRTGSMNIDR